MSPVRKKTGGRVRLRPAFWLGLGLLCAIGWTMAAAFFWQRWMGQTGRMYAGAGGTTVASIPALLRRIGDNPLRVRGSPGSGTDDGLASLDTSLDALAMPAPWVFLDDLRRIERERIWHNETGGWPDETLTLRLSHLCLGAGLYDTARNSAAGMQARQIAVRLIHRWKAVVCDAGQ